MALSHPINDKHLEVSNHRFNVRLAQSSEEVDQALALRYEVFGKELQYQHDYVNGKDRDRWDGQFDHLIATQQSDGRLVGTYRMQTYEMASQGQGFVCATEFDLSGLSQDFFNNSLEVGRSCVLKEYRKGWVLYLMWKSLSRYVFYKQKRFLFGCCSLNSQDELEGHKLWKYLRNNGHMHPDFHISPLPQYQFKTSGKTANTNELVLPELMRLYLQLGAKICGAPAFDSAYKTIDFFIVVDTEMMDTKTIERYLK